MYAFSPAFRERLAFYKQHGIGIVYGLFYGNRVAYPPTAENPDRPWDPEAYGRYAVAVTRMLKESGVRFAISLWNEPHNFELGRHFGGAWNGVPPCSWLDHYVKMVHAAVKAIKAVDPSVIVMTDEDVIPNHYYFIKAGLPRELDAFSLHYPSGPKTPDISSFLNDAPYVRPLVVVDQDKSLRSLFRRLREAGKASMGHEPQLWILEWGAPENADVTVNVQQHRGVTEDDVAVMLPRAFIVAETEGVQVVTWFSSYDGPDGPFGLQANNQRRRLAFFSYKTIRRLRPARRFHPRAAGGGSGDAHHGHTGLPLPARKRAEAGGVAHRRCAFAPSRRSTGALAGVRVIDKLGKEVDAPKDARGVRPLELGPSLYYLCGLPPSSDIELDAACTKR